ncbi:MAG: acyl-CoA dehydrogenase family protein, partial [Candidatus Binatia bacterium]
MSDLETFREEVRDWLSKSAPKSMFDPVRSEEELCWGGKKTKYPPDVMKWLHLMAERGWTAPTWPREYGGGGLSRAEAKVLQEEMRSLRLRPPLTGFGLTMIGPLLLVEGAEEQKREHMPRLVRGEVRWCQGYSEPGSGSDLASLQTRAVPDGDDYVVTGQKVWISRAEHSDLMLLMARTTPLEQVKKRTEGLSMLLVDMREAV